MNKQMLQTLSYDRMRKDEMEKMKGGGATPTYPEKEIDFQYCEYCGAFTPRVEFYKYHSACIPVIYIPREK